MGKTHVRRQEVRSVVIHAAGRDYTLSAEECRIILFVVAGYTNRDIARQFSLDTSTISRRAARLFAKLGVANKLELVLFVLHHGIMGDFLDDRG